MKRTGRYIAALAVLAAGSVFFGSLPANAGGIELDGIDIVFRRERDRGHMPPPPPPPPHHWHRPPPPHHWHRPHHHHRPGRRMPPPRW